ncbi:MAG: HAD-IA family hydrolase [Bdellovibrionales bacterium]|nr:HAD-IA family hydrolase [Bdellovibrionales bacterium]
MNKTIDFSAKELFIFDLDGTLLDTKKDIVLAVNHAVSKCGIPPKSESEIENLIASGTMTLIKDTLDSDKHFDEAFGHFSQYYQEHMFDHTAPYKGVENLLENLSHKTLVVLSNKRERFCKLLLEGLKLIGLFEMVVGGDTVAHKKPHPAPLLHILENLNIAPEQAVMIGDSPLDILAAKAARVQSIGLLDGFTSRKTMLEQDDADLLIPHLVDLIDLVS